MNTKELLIWMGPQPSIGKEKTIKDILEISSAGIGKMMDEGPIDTATVGLRNKYK